MLQLLEVSQGLGCDAVGEVGGSSMCLLESCWGSGSVVMRVLELERDPVVARAVFPTRTPCLKLPQTITASPGVGFRACPCSHPPGLGAQLSEQRPPNPGCLGENEQRVTSPSLCSGEGVWMGMEWEVGAGPGSEGFPLNAVVLKMRAEDEVVMAKPTEG